MKEFTTCNLFSYYRFKMESEKLKSYTQAFKKRVLIRLEENDNNKSKTAKNLYSQKDFAMKDSTERRYFQNCFRLNYQSYLVT